MFRSVWVADGEWIIGQAPHEQRVSGIDDIAATPAGRQGLLRAIRVCRVIDIDGNEATTRTLCHEAARGPSETYYRNHSVAFDRLRRAGDDWVFASRSFQYLRLDTTAYGGGAFPLFAGSAGRD